MAVAAVAAARKIREEHERDAAREAAEEAQYALTDSSDEDDGGVPSPTQKPSKPRTVGLAIAAAGVAAADHMVEIDTGEALWGHTPPASHAPAAAAEPPAQRPSPSRAGASAERPPAAWLGAPPVLGVAPQVAPGRASAVNTETVMSLDLPTPALAPPTKGRSAIGSVAKRATEVAVVRQKGANLSSFCADVAAAMCGSTEPADAPHAIVRGNARAGHRFRLPRQRRLARWYGSSSVQIIVAIIIAANFVANAIEAQLLPAPGGPEAARFVALEYAFNACFSVELLLNMYAHFFKAFWMSPWNVFDVTIVLVSWLSMSAQDLPGVSVLRLFRAFRVFRLFKRVESLRKIIESVVASMRGVGNAFAVLAILMGIWSIIGVEFFGAARPQLFGTFAAAMFTMWQVMTGDSAYSGLAKPLLYEDGIAVAAPFFVSYGFVAGVVMTNVVIAILLDAYLRNTAAHSAEQSNASTRAPLSERLWLLRRVLRAGRTQVAHEVLMARRLQRAVRAQAERRRKAADLPNRRAMRALAAVLCATIGDVFSEGALVELRSRERLGLLATLWSSRLARELIVGQNLYCSERATFQFARLTPAAALAHVLLLRLGARADERERKRAKDDEAREAARRARERQRSAAGA